MLKELNQEIQMITGGNCLTKAAPKVASPLAFASYCFYNTTLVTAESPVAPEPYSSTQCPTTESVITLNTDTATLSSNVADLFTQTSYASNMVYDSCWGDDGILATVLITRKV